MNQSLSTIYQPAISLNPFTHNLSIHLSLLSICSPIIYLSSLISIHPQLIYPSDVLPVNPLSNSTIYPSPISTINVSIDQPVCTIIDQPIYLHYLSSINLPFLSMQPPIIYLSKNLSTVYHVYLSMHSIIICLSCLSICLYYLPIIYFYYQST